MKLERIAPWLAGLVLAAPVLAYRYPPMGDLPMHEALVALLRMRNDPAFTPPGLYYVVAPQANQLFHWLAYLVSFALGTTLACKLVVAAVVLLVPVAMGAWLASIGRSRWAAVLVAPIACGWMFRWGLVPNLLGLLLLVLTLPRLERFARRPTRRLLVEVSVLSALVFFAHESSAFVLALAIAYYALVRGRRGLAAPLVVIVVLAALQFEIGKRLASLNMQQLGNEYGIDPVTRFLNLPGAIFGGFDHVRLAIVCGVWLAAHVAFAFARGKPSAGELPARVMLWRYRHGVLAAAFTFLYLGFPMVLAGTTLLAYRFVPVACVYLAAAVAPKRARLVPMLIGAAAPIAMLGIELRLFSESARSAEAVDELVLQIPNRTAVAQLDFTPRGPTAGGPIPGIANRALIVHGGRMLFAFTDTPPNPVYIRDDARWSEPIDRMALAPYALMPAYDAQRFSYLLARNTSKKARTLVLRALAPEYELVASRAEWDLFRSTLPTAPLDAPDRALPDPPPEVLLDRVNRLAAPAR